MDESKFASFLEEFPFLKEMIPDVAAICDDVRVRKCSPELLRMTPSHIGSLGSRVGIHNQERVHFVLLINGAPQVMMDAVPQSGIYAHPDGHTSTAWPGKTVLEAIAGLLDKERRDLEFVVKVDSGYKIRDHYSLPDWRATIYKVSLSSKQEIKDALSATRRIANDLAAAAKV